MKLAHALLTLALFTPTLAAQDVLHPREGQVLDHLHARFRWEPFESVIGPYYLQVVEDNGAANPFLGNSAVVGMQVPGGEPRVVVTKGLEFGKDYAWRALALVPPFPGVRAATPTHRFSTIPLPAYAPNVTVTRPPGAGPVQPGVTLFNLRIGGMPPPGGLGHLIAVDEDGEYLWFYEYDSRRTSDFRQLDDGRFLWILQSLVGVAGEEGTATGRAVEMTLDGEVTWISPNDPQNLWVHHEATRMPDGNMLLLTYDPRNFPGQTPSDWLGDSIVEVERHTHEVLGTWHAFDHYSMGDYNAQFGPGGDWTHGNAAAFSVHDGSVYYSARSLSRITRIDWSTKQPLYSFGETMPSGDTTFGNGLFSFEHAPEPQPNGNVLVFDNGNTHLPLTDPRQSAAVEMAFNDPLNPSAATVVWRFDLTDDQGNPLYAPFLGDADRLPNGNTLITAGPNVTLFEADAAAQLVWKLELDIPFPIGAIYRADRIDSLVKDTPGDVDDDWDLDLHDLAQFQNNYQGSVTTFPEKLSDTNRDGVLDDADFDHFFAWMTGPANHLGQHPNE